MKPEIPTVGAMEVELVQWPDDESRLTEMRSAGRARLVVVPEGVAPPPST